MGSHLLRMASDTTSGKEWPEGVTTIPVTHLSQEPYIGLGRMK